MRRENYETYFQTWKGRLYEMITQKGGVHTYTLSSASQILRYFNFFLLIHVANCLTFMNQTGELKKYFLKESKKAVLCRLYAFS